MSGNFISSDGKLQTPWPSNPSVDKYVAECTRRASAKAAPTVRYNSVGKRLVDYPPLQYEPVAFGKQWQFQVGRIGYARSVKILQVLDSDRALVTLGKKDITAVMIKGMSFLNVADDSEVSLGTLMEVAETTTYTTVMGATRTVFVLRPFDISPYSLPVEMVARP